MECEKTICFVQTFTDHEFSATLFIVDPTKEFNMSIDAPAEEYEDLFEWISNFYSTNEGLFERL